MAVMTSTELVNKVKDIATNYKTLYVYACFGSPMTQRNKERYSNNCDYNRSRKAMIMSASNDTFGFDCVNLIKGVLWGWNGNVNATYGGAVYASNGVPDTNANGMFQNYCYDKSNDFSNIIPGEFVWLNGHIGVYIGDGLVVECTPAWQNKVQITACGNIGSKSGYNTRTWTSHGKSKFIDYNSSEDEKIKEYLAPRGYLGKGDNSYKIKDICDWFSKNRIVGEYFGEYLEAIVKVYQKQAGKDKVGEPDGYIGPRTLKSMIDDGFNI
jgi:peptidoglycan hydrolase-like protein with peptidoglycan-binding domain